jgi:cyclopropane fatty-acyl-phospholipid synthase-like methyltransferase
VSDPRVEIVASGYDLIADRFAAWRDRITDDPRRLWAGELASRLADGARVLELGCGAGVPDTKLLAERFRVTGVDASAEQIRRARANVPEAEFMQGDFTAIQFDPGSFEAIAAFYSFNHVPRELLAALFARIHGWLVPGGYLLAALGAHDTPDWTGAFLGTTMFFSGYEPETNRRLLDEAGFERLLDDVVTIQEPDAPAEFPWVLARR